MSEHKKSTISIDVELDENKHPVNIEWISSDTPVEMDKKSAKGMLLSLFDRDHMDTYKIDLWTNDLQLVEMDRFMYQTLRALADTYFQATKNEDLANDMRKFVQYFGQETELLPKED